MESALEETTDRPSDGCKKHRRLSSSITVIALADAPLRIVHSIIENPVQLLAKLDVRHASKMAASRITKITDPITTKYKSIRSDTTKHSENMAATAEQFQSISIIIEEPLAVTILVASVGAPSLCPATAAIKSLAQHNLKWGTVAERLTDKTIRIGVIFLPDKALLIHLEENLKILGTAAQAEDGISYISDEQGSAPIVPKIHADEMCATMAILKEHASTFSDTKLKQDGASRAEEATRENFGT